MSSPPVPPVVAAPSISAEKQWLQTVVKPTLPSYSTVPTAPALSTKPSAQFFGTGHALRVPSLTHSPAIYRDSIRSSVPPSLQQTPSQLAAQRRMEIMQKELDVVIGMMNLNFDDNKCVVSPDRRLEEFYSNHCPEYSTNWKCKNLEDREAIERKKKRRRFWIQMSVLIGIVLLHGLFLFGDYLLSGWVIRHESDRELVESTLKRQRIKNQTVENVSPPSPPSAVHSRSTTLIEHEPNKKEPSTTTPSVLRTVTTKEIVKKVLSTLSPMVEPEVEVVNRNFNEDTEDLWGMIGETFPTEKDVLDSSSFDQLVYNDNSNEGSEKDGGEASDLLPANYN